MSAYKGRTVRNKSKLREDSRKINWLQRLALDETKVNEFLQTVPENMRDTFYKAIKDLVPNK